MATTWTCDVCKVASFLTYDEAVKHEDKCNGVPPPPGATSTTTISVSNTSNNQQLQSQQQLVQQQMSRDKNHAVPNPNGGHRNHIMNSVASNNTATSATSAPASRGSGVMPHILPLTNMMLAPHQQDAKAPPQQQQASQNIGKFSVAVTTSAIYEKYFLLTPHYYCGTSHSPT